MTEHVKPRRSYDSRRRREQAAQTRQEILGAAGKLFREQGYSGTSMVGVATEAGVVVETIYRTFGSKSGLFRAVMEAVLAGGRGDVPVEQRPAIRAVIEEPDSRRQVALYVATQPGIHRRAGPLLRALREGMASDRELRAVWDEMEAWRLDGQGRFVTMLANKGALRPELSAQRARDVVWTLCSLAVHDLLVLGRGWTAEQYSEWLTNALTCELLPAVQPTDPPDRTPFGGPNHE